MTRHTPGPWRKLDEDDWTVFSTCVLSSRLVRVADCSPESALDFDGHQAVANATLVAAAPDMLRALKVAAEMLMRGTVHEDNLHQANRERAHTIVVAAINKAEGHNND